MIETFYYFSCDCTDDGPYYKLMKKTGFGSYWKCPTCDHVLYLSVESMIKDNENDV